VARLTDKTCFHQPGLNLCLMSWIKLHCSYAFIDSSRIPWHFEATPHLNVPVFIYYLSSGHLLSMYACPETCWSSEPRVALMGTTVARGFEDQQVSCSGLW